jgi:hypothetical protein
MRILTKLTLTGASVSAGLCLMAVALYAEPTQATAPVASPQDMQVRAEAMVTQVSTQVQRLDGLDRDVRAGRDGLKLACVDHQVTIASSLSRAANEQLQSLRVATQSNNAAAATVAYRQIVALASASDHAERAADSCHGARELVVGQAAAPTPPPPLVQPDDSAPAPAPAAPAPAVVVHGKNAAINQLNRSFNPVHDCNVLGAQSWLCPTPTLEFVAWASPYQPR